MDKLCRPQPGYADWRREYAGLVVGKEVNVLKVTLFDGDSIKLNLALEEEEELQNAD